MGAFERSLSVWVAVSMALGLLLGRALPGLTGALRELELGEGSHINLPIALLIWLMVYPITLGKGKRLFAGGTIPAAFKVTEGIVTPCGVIVVNYERAGAITTGS